MILVVNQKVTALTAMNGLSDRQYEFSVFSIGS